MLKLKKSVSLILFAGLFAAGIAQARDPQVHFDQCVKSQSGLRFTAPKSLTNDRISHRSDFGILPEGQYIGYGGDRYACRAYVTGSDAYHVQFGTKPIWKLSKAWQNSRHAYIQFTHPEFASIRLKFECGIVTSNQYVVTEASILHHLAMNGFDFQCKKPAEKIKLVPHVEPERPFKAVDYL